MKYTDKNNLKQNKHRNIKDFLNSDAFVTTTVLLVSFLAFGYLVHFVESYIRKQYRAIEKEKTIQQKAEKNKEQINLKTARFIDSLRAITR